MYTEFWKAPPCAEDNNSLRLAWCADGGCLEMPLFQTGRAPYYVMSVEFVASLGPDFGAR